MSSQTPENPMSSQNPENPMSSQPHTWDKVRRFRVGQRRRHGSRVLGTLSAIFLKSAIWKNGTTIVVKCLPTDRTDVDMAFFERVLTRSFPKMGVAFRLDPEAARSHVRVSFDADDLNWSCVGTDCLSVPQAEPTMNIATFTANTILHEFGHALGMMHQHQHPDANIPWDEERILKSTDLTLAEIRANITQPLPRKWLNDAPYDKDSKMHYTVFSYMTKDNCCPVIPKWWYGNRFSMLDEEWMQKTYPVVEDAMVDHPFEQPIEMAALIAAIVLAALLVGVAGVALVRRRRTRKASLQSGGGRGDKDAGDGEKAEEGFTPGSAM